MLAKLGCEIATVLIDETGELFNFGSAGGHAFWSCNPDVNVKFKEMFGKVYRVSLQLCFAKCDREIGKFIRKMATNCMQL